MNKLGIRDNAYRLLSNLGWVEMLRPMNVGTKGVSQNHLLSFDDNKVLKL